MLPDEKHMSHQSLFFLPFKDVTAKKHFMVQDCGTWGFSCGLGKDVFQEEQVGDVGT